MTREQLAGGLVFVAPGPGSWHLEATHLSRPFSKFVVAVYMAGFRRGFAEGMARYGLLIDHVENAVVNGFIYSQPRIIGVGEPDGPAMEAAMQDRFETSFRAIKDKLWRQDLDQWDQVDKPAAISLHRAIQDVDPTALSDGELDSHLRRCRDHLEAMFYLHHKYTAAAFVSVGDFLAGAEEWTGAAAGELLQLLNGTSPISAGFVAAELDALIRSIRAHDSAKQVLYSAAQPVQILDVLIADQGVGATTRDYLDAVRFRSIGNDVGDPNAGEMPELLVEAIRASVSGATAAPYEDANILKIKERVPASHLTDFEDRLGEARLMNRLRDERCVYADGWAIGLARRALLEAGRRLHNAGKLLASTHAVDMEAAELAAVLRGESGPSADEVAQRYRWRTSSTIDDVPPLLGPRPNPPPPLESLPPAAHRSTRALNAALSNLARVPETANTETVLHGLAVNAKIYEGTARVVNDSADVTRIRQGDVLVARLTSPYFNVVLPLLGAIVTDRGGPLSHAAIVAREYGIPGIVGTRQATQLIPDGSRVRVDGKEGAVTLLR